MSESTNHTKTNSNTLIEVRNLNIRFKQQHKIFSVVKDFNFKMSREKVAIVGESGAGKSQTARAILGCSKGLIDAEYIGFDGIDLQTLSKSEHRRLCAKRMAMIMQDPKYSLDPIVKVGKQLQEVILDLPRKVRRERIFDVLNRVNIRHPEKVYEAYPFELSGGMGQRVMIAQTLLTQPDFLVADEPTSSIDATARRSVIDEIERLVEENQMGLLFISHDLPLVSSVCDRILVMYQGEVVEDLLAKDLKHAEHPYTRALIACIPSASHKGGPLVTVDRNALATFKSNQQTSANAPETAEVNHA